MAKPGETKIYTVCPKCGQEIEIDISEPFAFIVKVLRGEKP